MMKTNLTVGFLLLAVSAFAATPKIVENSVACEQKASKVVITYRLEGAPGIVTVDVFTNGVFVGDAAGGGMTGDVNALVQPGDRTILWKPRFDWVKGLDLKGCVTYRVKVTPETLPPDYMIVDLASGAINYYASSNAVPGGVQSDVYKKTKMAFRKIPAANKTWRIGDIANVSKLGDGYHNRNRPGLVQLTYDYWAGVFELTHEQVKTITGSYSASHITTRTGTDGVTRDRTQYPSFDDWSMCPADGESITALRGDPTAAACLWPEMGRDGVDPNSLLGILRKRTGGKMLFDMPTSAEWEYAARGGSERTLPDGTEAPDEATTGKYAWFSSNAKTDDFLDQYGAGRTHKVGEKLPNGWGLYDTLGNLYEVVLDYCPADDHLDTADLPLRVNPVGIDRTHSKNNGGNCRMARGGCYSDGWTYCRPSFVHNNNVAELNALGQWFGHRIFCPIAYAKRADPTTSEKPTISFDVTTREAVIDYTLAGSEPKIVTVDVMTNGVSIGAANFSPIAGDVNRIVQPGPHRIYWRPDQTWTGHVVDTSVDKLTVSITEWPTNNPPDYAVVSLEGAFNPMYYTCAEAIPGGVGDKAYKTEYMVFRKIPAAGVTWRMGNDGVNGELAAAEKGHLVQLTKDYWIGIYQVTQRQFYLLKKIYWCFHNDVSIREILPVEQVGWLDGGNGEQKNAIRGTTATWPSSHVVTDYSFLGHFRALNPMFQVDLPTDAQWEFAYRAGVTRMFPYLNDDSLTQEKTDPYVWNAGNWNADPLLTENATHIVGLKLPNKWGIYDMGGNLLEWCLDWYAADIVPSDGRVSIDPVGPAAADDGKSRVTRGGAFSDGYNRSRATCRTNFQGTNNDRWRGFRVVAPIVPEPLP